MDLEHLFAPPPPGLALGPGEVHVFCAALDLPPARLKFLETHLSADESVRAERLVFTRDRNRFIAAHGQLREILGRLLRADPSRLAFLAGKYGKPRLAGQAGRPNWQFNLAHSDALMICIVSDQSPVGVDVERIRPVREARHLMAHFFSESENAVWRAQPLAQQTEAFFERWTRREALLKAVGGSLAQAPSRTGFDAIEDGARFSHFSLHRLMPACGYLATAAIQGAAAPYCWRWVSR